MNREQFNRTEMFNTVTAFMDRHRPIWIGNRAMEETIAQVRSNNDVIADKMRRQQTPITGAAEEKGQIRLDFQDKILEIADQLSALADKRKDANLNAQCEFTLSGLDKLADNDLEETGQRVCDLAEANLAALADYAITQADLASLDGLKTQFGEVKTGPRAAIAERAGETLTLPGAIDRQTSLLRNQLDKQMTRYRKSHPEFYAGYRSARVIVDRGGSNAGVPIPPPAVPVTT